MAKQERGLFATVARIDPSISVGQWAYDRIIGNWAAIVTIASGGGMTYLASITKWLNHYGPVAWGAVGIGSALVVALITYIMSIAKKYRANAYYLQESAKPTEHVNPLESSFERKRFRVHEFFSSFLLINKGKSFTECDIVGPGSIALIQNCTVTDAHLLQCDIVVVKAGLNTILGAAGFDTAIFNRCRFFNVTMIVTEETALQMKATLKPGSEGLNFLRAVSI
jgi:hypothetical protein